MAGMEKELDRRFKHREELHRKMEETVAALAATEDQVCLCSLRKEQNGRGREGVTVLCV